MRSATGNMGAASSQFGVKVTGFKGKFKRRPHSASAAVGADKADSPGETAEEPEVKVSRSNSLSEKGASVNAATAVVSALEHEDEPRIDDDIIDDDDDEVLTLLEVRTPS